MDRTHEHPSNLAPDFGLHPADLFHVLRKHVRLWAVPAVACAALATAYALVAPRDWRASQSLIIRAEAASISDERLGKFTDLAEMKTLQETIFELAKSRGVVEATLQHVGPPSRYSRKSQWPTLTDVERFREQLDMRPPGGAEFGKTEVFYISVRETNRERAAELVAALCDQLETRMQQVRDQRAQSMAVELERTVAMAENDLAANTKELTAFEAAIGADLAELRNLNAMVGGQGEISQELVAIETERRANEALRRENARLLELLEAAQDDPQKLLATPNSLLRSQPGVSRLKNALVDAQVYTANLLGSRSERHPHVVAARETEESIRRQLHDELAVAIQALEVDVELNADREEALMNNWLAARNRLTRLAEARAVYANLVASVENHSKLVEGARKNLADARARQAGARSASVISRIDGVEAGVRPVGLGRTTVVAAGGMGGLIFGFGLVFLFAAPFPSVRHEPSAPQFTDAATRTHDRNHANTANGFDFRGMTLEEAIRSVERPTPSRNGRK